VELCYQCLSKRRKQREERVDILPLPGKVGSE
jgi:hypothetical protein